MAIERLRKDDLVLSRDEHDVGGEVGAKAVEETFVRHGEIRELRLGGRAVLVTPEHPVFVRDRGWTPAGELRDGDLLSTIAGDWIAVEGIRSTGESTTVYNLRVADWHTDFVGDDHWPFALWVHNAYNAHKAGFGSNDLSSLALESRKSGCILRRQNAVVSEYVDNAGNLRTKLFKNVQGDPGRGRATLHAEEVMDAWFQKQGISPNQVSRIYTEYYPCSTQSCRQLLFSRYSESQVSWSFPYDRPGGFWTTIGRGIRATTFNSLGLP